MFSIFYSSLSIISSLLVLSLLPWYVRYKNVPGLFTVAWLFVVDFLYGLNAAVFKGDALLRAPAYCDIVTKLLMGLQIVVPVAMLCYVLSIQDWMDRPQGRNLGVKLLEHRGFFHAALCFFIPFAYMVLHIPVQDHRFDIVENVGCLPSTSNTAIAWAIIWGIPMLPFCGVSVFAILTVKHILAQDRIVHERQTPWEKFNSELIFTNAPFGIFRILRLSIMICVVMLWTLALPYYAVSVFVHSDDFVFANRPDLARIDVFASLSDASSGVAAIKLFLWTGPVYSILFFAASVDKDVLQSYPFLFKKLILRRPALLPDPSPGIDLSTLTPIPVRRRLYRRVMRKSRQYDPPLSFLEYDIPLPPRPEPGFRTTASLPPVPKPSKPKKAYVDPRFEEVHPTQKRPRVKSRAFPWAMQQHAKLRGDRLLYPIPEVALHEDSIPDQHFSELLNPAESREEVDNRV